MLSHYPSFFTDPRVPLDASITCEAACACNKKHGYGPPDCYQPGQPWPDWVSKCYCDGHNIAYDKTKFDQCGYYLPIFGEGVLLPSQYESYKDYAKKNGLDNAYPAPATTMCKPIDDVLTPPSPSGPPPGGTNVQTREERVLPVVAHAKNLNQVTVHVFKQPVCDLHHRMWLWSKLTALTPSEKVFVERREKLCELIRYWFVCVASYTVGPNLILNVQDVGCLHK